MDGWMDKWMNEQKHQTEKENIITFSSYLFLSFSMASSEALLDSSFSSFAFANSANWTLRADI